MVTHEPGEALRKPRRIRTRDLRLLAMALLACLSVWPFDSAIAVSACPEGVEVVQPDGTRFRLHLRGDEFFAWHETADGYAVRRDSADGFWKFAQPAAGRAEFRAIPGARVGVTDPAQYGLRKHALPDAAVLRAHARERQRTLRGQPVELPVPEAVPGAQPATHSEETVPGPPPAQIPVSGTKTIKNIVILACFSNHWNSSASTVLSAQGLVSVGAYSNLFNQVGYTTDGAVGSVRDYYSEVSYGKLTVQSAVTPWVKLPKSESYYGTDGAGIDANVQQMVADAINAAAAAGFDFSQGDSDADGWADCLTIIHSGHGQEYSGNPTASAFRKSFGLMRLGRERRQGVQLEGISPSVS